jgi:hypothetical protein
MCNRLIAGSSVPASTNESSLHAEVVRYTVRASLAVAGQIEGVAGRWHTDEVGGTLLGAMNRVA